MNKPNPIPNPSVQRASCAQQFVRTWTTLQSAVIALALVAGALFVSSAQAQTATFGPVPCVRLTVPVGYTGMVTATNNFTYTTNGVTPDGNGAFWILPLDVNVTGLPSGVSYVLTNASDLVNLAPFTSTALRSNSNNTLRMWTTFTLDGSTPEGTYTYTISASNSTYGIIGYLYLTLDVAHIWNGSTNFVADGSSSWSDATKWLGGGVPGTSGNVIISDLGGQTNFWAIAGGVTNWAVDTIINSDVTIGSLRFSSTNTTYGFHTIRIDPGYTLKITGNNGFSILRDYINELSSLTGTRSVVTFLGTNATLLVSNTSANFALLNDNNAANSMILDLSRVSNFKAVVNRFGLGDFSLYPNYWNMDTNNFGNHGNTPIPRKMAANASLAQTNIIQTSFVGPDNYNNDTTRDYALQLSSRTAYGSGFGSSPQPLTLLGMSNIFYADSVCFNGMGAGAAGIYCRFGFTNNPIAIFRGPSGGTNRVSFMGVADAAGRFVAVGSTKGGVDFGMNNGIVDALVDRLVIAADHPLIAAGSSSQPNQQGFLGMGAGTFDVNTVILGYQNSGLHTNDPANNADYRGYCQGTLAVSNTAVFKINNTLTLGYTTETNTGSVSTGGEPGQNRGQVNITFGGTVMANTILVGGVTKASQQNNISIASANANISSLVVSNTIADTTQRLSTLAFGGNGNLTLHVDGSLSVPYVYVTNMTTSGQNNSIGIGGVKNITYVGGVAQVPLISYLGGSPTLLGVRMPSGFVGSGTIVQNGANQWDLYISTNAPNTNLVWRPIAGIGSTNWDSTSLVWSNRNDGYMTNFHSGDVVYFDDTPNLASNINQTISPLLPGNIFMTNQNVKYTITGLGLQGGAVLTKTGTGTLDVDGNAAIAFSIVQGSLTNRATRSIGGVAVTAGASLVNLGTINGGINCAGTTVNSGTINGTLAMAGTGVVTNLSGANINGQPTFQDGSFLYNQGTITYNQGTTCTVSSNATLINDGNISGDYLVVNGTLKDTGVGNIVMYNWLTINGPPTAGSLTNPVGGLFIPGGDGVGITRVMGNIGSSASYAGRVQLLAGARVLMKVTNDNNTLLYSGFQDFGPSASTLTYNGCILIITNVGTVPFANGQVFTMFRRIDTDGTPQNSFQFDGTSTNTYPLISSNSPGAGLVWDLKYLYRHDPADDQNGKIGVFGTSTMATNVMMVIFPTNGVISIASYTTNNSVITTNWATNNFIYTTLTWPTNNVGWRLQSQNNNGYIGLSNNWVTMFQTPFTNYMYVTNDLKTNNTWFYRMVYP
jgi:hypothetical protein